MPWSGAGSDPRLALIAAALGSVAWKGWSEQALAGRIVGALDGRPADGRPAPALGRDGDDRIDVVRAALRGSAWRLRSAAAVARRALAALDAHHARMACIDIELAWLLDEADV